MENEHIDNFINVMHELNVVAYEFADKSPKEAEDEVEELLILAYLEGKKAAETFLDTKVDADVFALLEQSVNKVIAGKTFRDRIREYVEQGAVEEIGRVLETEYHRVFNEGMLDTGKVISTDTNTQIKKTWLTVADDKVRETHDYLEGMTIGIEERFYAFDGDSADAPGGFGKAENNINCRCVLSFEY